MLKTLFKVIIIAIIVYALIKFIDPNEVCNIIGNIASNVSEQDWIKIFKHG